MSSPINGSINGSLLRAKQFVPQFAGTQPDADVAQAHAMIAIGELLQLILGELQTQRIEAQNAQRMASREQAQSRHGRRAPATIFAGE